MLLVLALLLTATPGPGDAVTMVAVTYVGKWYPEKDELTRQKSAAKQCGSMFVGSEEQPRAIANLTSAQCLLPGLRLATVTAFNQRLAASGESGWDAHPVP